MDGWWCVLPERSLFHFVPAPRLRGTPTLPRSAGKKLARTLYSIRPVGRIDLHCDIIIGTDLFAGCGWILGPLLGQGCNPALQAEVGEVRILRGIVPAGILGDKETFVGIFLIVAVAGEINEALGILRVGFTAVLFDLGLGLGFGAVLIYPSS